LSLPAGAQFPIQDGVKILFIGNSLTGYQGGLDNWVEAAGAADTPPVTIDAQTSLIYSSELSRIYNDGAARTAIADGDFDAVVLQGWNDPITEPDSFYKYVELFDQDIRASGAKTVLFMTWPLLVHTTWAHTTLRNRYDSAGTLVDASVVHVGTVWWGLRRRVPPGFGLDTTSLFADDVHPSELGQYVSSLCFYTFLTQASPEGVDYTVGGFTIDDALEDTLQQRVWKTISLDVDAYVGVNMPACKPAVLTRAPEHVLRSRSFLLNGAIVRHTHGPGDVSGGGAPGILVQSRGHEKGTPSIRALLRR